MHQIPDSICILRLSAIGDISHTLPVVRTIQHAWPKARITWIIGKTEHALVGDIADVEFIVVDKAEGWRAYRSAYLALKGRKFNVLLHMQMSLRASLISMLVNAPVKIGFDRKRAKDFQWLFTNKKIAHKEHQHVMDSLFGFAEAIGIPHRVMAWDIPIPQDAQDYVHAIIPAPPRIVISPCSSMAYRNWDTASYAAVAIHAIHSCGASIILCGGNTMLERQYGAEIMARADRAGVGASVTNLIGRTNLKQLLAVLQSADLLISPDSGPAHLATAVGTPVIGLYATTNPDRAAPYLSRQYVINKYPEAVKTFMDIDARRVAWGRRVKTAQAMALIRVEDVTHTIDQWWSNHSHVVQAV